MPVSSRSVVASMTSIPTSVATATTVCDTPVWRNWDSESMSVVMRVMIRPDAVRSKKSMPRVLMCA